MKALLPRLFTGVLMTLCLHTGATAQETANEDEARALLAERLGNMQAKPAVPQVAALMRTLYRRNDHRLLWSDPQQGPTTAAKQALATLSTADEHGLEPAEYRVEWLKNALQQARPRFWRGPNAQERVALELGMSYSVLSYAADQLDGRLEPEDLLEGANADIYLKPRQMDLTAWLVEAVNGGAVGQAMTALAPTHQEYRQLQAVLQTYRDLEKGPAWPTVDEGPLLELGATGDRVVQVRARLIAGGDLTTSAASGPYDEALAMAVRAFQERNGIVVDGKVGGGTLAAMNESIAQRIRRLKLNMDRWRWLPEQLGEDYILVNVPEFSVVVRRQQQDALRMAVVVGKELTPTPLFADQLEYAVIAPYWNLPSSITLNELLPKLVKDPEHLTRKRYQVLDGHTVLDPATLDFPRLAREGFPYRIRQRPGYNNALGLVKFIFPNRFAVYMHDTPADALFDKDVRAFSHGCIRLERPFDMANELLGTERDWQQLARELADDPGSEPVKVHLEKPLPVYISYFSVRPDGHDGRARFLYDIYGYDADSLELLDRQRPGRAGSH